MPLIRIKMIIQKNATNMYCCCVPEKVEIKSATPRTAIRKTELLRNMSKKLPSKGMLNASFPITSPSARSVNPIRRKGAIFAIMK
jgi:hypothetical protein